MEHYNSPPMSAPSSIVMLILCITSILCTTYAVIKMLRIGIRSQLAELTAVINFAMTVWTVSSLPYIYHRNHLCAVFGVFLWYSLVQLVIAASLMMYGAKEYIIEVQTTQGMGNGTERLTLNYVSRILLYIVPGIPPLFPLVTSSYGRMYCWCTIDLDAKWGEESSFILNVACWSPVILLIYYYYNIALKVAGTMTSSELVYQVVLKGPVMYGTATIGMFVCAAAYSFVAALVYRKQSSESLYYGQYVFTVAVCLLGISYIFIFERNLEHVKAMEAYVRNADEFRREFGCSRSSEEGNCPPVLMEENTALSAPILADDTSLRHQKPVSTRLMRFLRSAEEDDELDGVRNFEGAHYAKA